MKRNLCALSLAILGLTPIVNGGTEYESFEKEVIESNPEGPGFAAIGAWDSRYVLEGRDMLVGDSLYGFTLEGEYAGFLAGAWLSHSPETDYQEQNYFVEYGFELGPVEAYVSYMHLQFMSDNDQDNEVGGGIAVPDAIFGWTPALDAYYSDAAGGYFAELSIAREFFITDQFVIVPTAIFGYNDGYIADGHNGANHVLLQLIAAYAISENFAIEGYIAQTFAIDSNPAQLAGDGNLYDFSFVGVGASIAF